MVSKTQLSDSSRLGSPSCSIGALCGLCTAYLLGLFVHRYAHTVTSQPLE